jgi:hypothetical protein
MVCQVYRMTSMLTFIRTVAQNVLLLMTTRLVVLGSFGDMSLLAVIATLARHF